MLATSFVFATCAINVLAAGSARTLTVDASPKADLEAGSSVTVEVKLSDIDGLDGLGYTVRFDDEVFSIDTSKTGRNKYANYVDGTWYNGLKDESTDWGYFLGEPGVMNQSADEGWITFGWSASDPISEPTGSTADFVVGKFTFTVKDGVIAESSNIYIDESPACSSSSTGGASDTLSFVPCTVAFKQSAPTPVTPKWDITITEGTGDMEAKDNNKVWQIAPVKSGEAEDISEFKVTLKDGNNDEITKELDEENITKMNNDIKSWNMASVFYVGLLNTGNHENVTATWNIAAGSSTVNVN